MMSKVIWKYSLDVTDGEQDIVIPQTAQVAHARMSPEIKAIDIWFIHSPYHAIPFPRKFRVVGTGHPIRDKEEHVITCDDGVFMWHIVEVVKR